MNIPSLTARQMRQVDELMVRHFKVSVLQMMERDALAIAEVAKKFLSGKIDQQQVVVFAGWGGNGGAGLAAARLLHNWGAQVSVIYLPPAAKFSTATKCQFVALKKLTVSLTEARSEILDQIYSNFKNTDLVIDALLGYSLKGDPRGLTAELINLVNQLSRDGISVLANDLPSGLDPDRGLPGRPCVKADVTVTPVLPKAGMLQESAGPWLGQLYLADIGVPPELYQNLNLSPPNIFARNWLVRLR